MSQENEVRALLRRWGRAVRRLKEIERLKKAIGEELDAVSDIRPQQLTGMPHGTNVGRPTEENAFRRMAMEKNRLADLDDEERHLKAIVEDAEWAASFIDDREQQLIRLHYVESLPMEIVSEVLHIDPRHAWRIERHCIKTITNFRKC